ncbi:MAG: site-2 protease family protein [Dehalococcoidia bacterium]|nr:site-2 protease family protein [Dehalococcoidia bacterium]
MLFAFDQFRDNPPALFAYLAAVLLTFGLGLVFHEFCHAWTAYELGDNTAARQGRLSLNPARHLDPMGSILLLVVGFGFARPTPFTPSRLRIGARWGSLLVAAAGPVSNFVIAALAALPIKLGYIDSVTSFDGIADASGREILGLFLVFIAWFNVLLGIFNLIPIPPLDGSKVAYALVPALRPGLQALEQWGMGILMTLFVISFLAPQLNVLGWFMGGVGNEIFRLIT